VIFRCFKLPDFRDIPRRDYLLALLSGIMLAAAFPLPGLSTLAWVALVPLLMTLHRRTPAQSLVLGFVAGLLANLGILYWVNIVMTTYGKLPLIASLFLYGILATYLALYIAVVIWLVRAADAWRISSVISLPVAWVAAEFIRANLLTGFPWASLGYTQYKILPVIQIADLAGVYGVSFLLVFTNAVCSHLIRGFVCKEQCQYPLKSAAVLALFLFCTVWYGLNHLNELDTGPVARIALVQGNIPQDVKWDPTYVETTVATYERLSREVTSHGTDLIVWPESALPLFYQNDPVYAGRLRGLAKELESSLLFGSPAFERDSGTMRYLNSAFMINNEGVDVGRSDKQHLVPFGEYVPMARLLPFVNKLVVGIGDFVPGKTIKPLQSSIGPVGVLVCFEGIFPELSRRYAAAGSRLLVNITNDAWFGRSSAPWQHLSMTVFRAIENRVPVVRAANTGVSAFISSRGEIEQATVLFVEAAIHGEVRLGKGTRTLYGQLGDLFAIICLGLTALGGGLIVWRRCRN
jgi:apolipoprotein N-acyltransferase